MKSIFILSYFAVLLTSTCTAMEMPKGKKTSSQLPFLGTKELPAFDKHQSLQDMTENNKIRREAVDLDFATDQFDAHERLNNMNLQEKSTSPFQTFKELKLDLIRIAKLQQKNIKDAELKEWQIKLQRLKDEAQIKNMHLFRQIIKFEKTMQSPDQKKDITTKKSLDK